MSERDELESIIAERYHAARPSPTVLDSAIAGAILAAGYRRPRTITTVAEMDALPEGSVILDRHAMTWQKHDAGNDPLWHAAKHNTFRYNSSALIVRLPATVLHEPEATL